MSPLDSFWNGVLSLLTPLVTPDWGKLVALIPLLLLLLVLAFLALVGRAWWRLFRSQPVRGPKVRPVSFRRKLVGHVAVMGIGLVTVILAFAAGTRIDWPGATSWPGGTSPAGLYVNFPLLVLGLAVMIGATGHAARTWERNGRDDIEPDALDNLAAAVGRHPARAKRVVVFTAGVLTAATSIGMGAVPGVGLTAATDAAARGSWPTDVATAPVPVAVFPLLILGLALAVGATGSGIAAVWRRGEEVEDTAPGDEAVALVPTEH